MSGNYGGRRQAGQQPRWLRPISADPILPFYPPSRPGSTCACTSPTKRAVSESSTTQSAGTLRRTTNTRFVVFLGTFARPDQQVWLPDNDLQDPSTWDAPPSCTLKRMKEDILQNYDCSDLQAAAQPPQLSGAAPAALLTKRTQPRILSTQAPRTTATANYFRSSTASTRHSSGVRFPPRRPPALRTSSPICPAPFPHSGVSRSSSAPTGANSRPCVSAMPARASRSSASSTAPRNARPHDKTPLSEWR